MCIANSSFWLVLWHHAHSCVVCSQTNFLKVGFHYRFQFFGYDRLCHPVFDRKHSKHTHLTIPFRYLHSLDC